METEKKIRNQAKDALNGNWTTVLSGLFLIFSIILLLFLLFNFIANLVNIWNENGTVKNKYEVFYIVLICSLVVVGFILSPFKNGF
ncbi:MAG: hypothetical protein J1E41_02045, partial [Ruminococcus sp.]|nr:hypothetical protein [Ruminococcus sp.]